MDQLPPYHLDHMFRQSYHVTNYGYPPQPANPFMDFRSVETDFLNVSDGMSPIRSCRGMEVRKEKSRDAARSRRGKENYEFYELAKLLPLPAAITSQLDKASIIRLCISYLNLRDFSRKGHPPWIYDDDKHDKEDSILGLNKLISTMTYDNHQGSHILHSLDGFAFILSMDGRFLYVSETVSIYLGLSQVEVIGCCVFDYVHHHDHAQLSKQLALPVPHYISGDVSPDESDATSPCPPSPPHDKDISGDASPDESDATSPRPPSPTHDKARRMKPDAEAGPVRCFCIRMKCTLTKRGMHTKSTGYRVVQMVTHIRYGGGIHRNKHGAVIGVVGLAIALPPPTITEWRLEHDMFVMRLSPHLTVLYCEEKVSELMDISSSDLTSTSLYSHCHPADLAKLGKSHTDLLEKGQVLTDYYRVLNKHGGYVWVQTCATTLVNKNPDDISTIAVNYILSGIEYGGCVMSLEQMKVVSGDMSIDSNIASDVTSAPQMRTLATSADTAKSSHSPPTKKTNQKPTDDRFPNGRRKSEKSRKRKCERIEPINSNTNNYLAQKEQTLALTNPEREMESVVLDANVSLPTDLSLKTSGKTTERQHKTPHDTNMTKADTITMPVNSDTRSNDEKSLLVTPNLETFNSPKMLDFDFSKQSEKRYTDQYMSINTSHWSDYNGYDNSSLPASYFLRSLYANRETVIRSNVNNSSNILYQNYSNGSLYSPQTYGKSPLGYGKNTFSPSTYGKTPLQSPQLLSTLKPYTLPNHNSYGSHDYSSITPPSSTSPHDKSHDLIDQSLLSKQAWCSISVPGTFPMHYDRSGLPEDPIASPIVPYCASIPSIKHNAGVFPSHNLWYHPQ